MLVGRVQNGELAGTTVYIKQTESGFRQPKDFFKMVGRIFPCKLTEIPKESQTIEQRACAEAVEVFHKNVRLKNESSFQLNSYNVKTYDEVYQGNENFTRYFVTLNYSAQNSFGGNSTDTYEVVLLYNNEDDTFTTLSAGK